MMRKWRIALLSGTPGLQVTFYFFLSAQSLETEVPTGQAAEAMARFEALPPLERAKMVNDGDLDLYSPENQARPINTSSRYIEQKALTVI